jgi:hypothetical protein
LAGVWVDSTDTPSESRNNDLSVEVVFESLAQLLSEILLDRLRAALHQEIFYALEPVTRVVRAGSDIGDRHLMDDAIVDRRNFRGCPLEAGHCGACFSGRW